MVRNYLTLIIALVSIVVSSQDILYKVIENDSTYIFAVSKPLVPIVDDFFTHAKKNNYSISKVADLHGVYKTNVISHYTGSQDAGLTMISRDFKDIIFINDNLPTYLPTLIEVVVYHEFYHFFANNKDHCDTIFCPYILQSGDKIDVEYVIRTWGEDDKKEYFEYLKIN
ncbi:hypothetical protein Phi4:1_gp083 [Cellulophaga phage phi4:1]|jgi:predicted Zn-dependent protease with MMP-like domain|uniref:Uncharacterized protein n=3 Tax=Lightbulbvirus Cba41 TaxID=1918524 RepID=A0A0S2MWI1_9CAUD|nr:hypothetical protein Phi4:1_gp083 [Cellulophaga phage phi4:1]AGO49496.1 hypothetical protein Phi4:1_gp083 [Cellulophaga phage phi4:1]ALO80092.1 hypothetical protein Phi4113_083 [Cellulophaga phage phi4:1_13]ALO80289.1 hypothetical protein Phi4118_083 [Cellulophaga phage phi4:1_18]